MQSNLLHSQGGRFVVGNVSGTKRPNGSRSSSLATEGTRPFFRAGYLTKIEDSIRTEFPDSDLKGTPHITSKISTWKKSYGMLKGILGRSGVGFNTHGTYKIDCDDDQWEQIADKDAKFMRTKLWPFWETWKSIFGKDRASGGGAEQVDAAAEHLKAQLGGGSQVNENDYRPSYEDASEPYVQPVDLNDDNFGNSGKQASTTKPSSHKGKQYDHDTVMMEFLSHLHAKTNNRLEMISTRIGYEFDLGKAR
uniref:Myb/SANT-like domain-containing protein n=1 Tax=Salvia splendens TaxID=180675 RepID=A0A8X8X3M6_SALSN|nr:hypothetical protein SASPL_133079 [Salvia splendens]